MTPTDLYNHGLEHGPSVEFDELIAVHCLGLDKHVHSPQMGRSLIVWRDKKTKKNYLELPATTTGKLNITDAVAFARKMLGDWKDVLAHIPDDGDIFSDDELAFTITMVTLEAMEDVNDPS